MAINLTELTEHDLSDDCPICKAQDVVHYALLPAAAAWETRSELPRFSVALHGAAELLGVILQEGVERHKVDAAVSRLLDDIEQRISEDQVLGEPPRGKA